MRHNVAKKKMGRDFEHRESLLKNLTSNVLIHEKINTTLEKAKFAKPFVEKVITKAKKAFAETDKIAKFNAVKDIRRSLGNDEAARKVIESIASRFEKRNGGYTRIVRTGNRDGDNANTARLELLPAEKTEVKTPVKSAKTETKKTKTAKAVKKEKENAK